MAFPGTEPASLTQSWSMPWSGATGVAGVLVQDAAAAWFAAKHLNGAPVVGAGASDPITGTISLEGLTMVSGTLRVVLGPSSVPPTAIGYQWQRAAASSGSFSNISGATGLSDSPTALDLGLSLRIPASLTNGAGQENPMPLLRFPVVQRLIEAQGNTLLSQNPTSGRLAREVLGLGSPRAQSEHAHQRERQGGRKWLRRQPHPPHQPAPTSTIRSITGRRAAQFTLAFHRQPHGNPHP